MKLKNKMTKAEDKTFNFFKKKEQVTSTQDEISDEIASLDQESFESFFGDVLKNFPKKTSDSIMKSFNASKAKAEKLVDNSRENIDKVFDEFLKEVDEEIKKKAHRTVHFASLSAAIIGFTPIPFADAFLLVPVQLTMMARLHKFFGQPWAEAMGKSLAKELVVVGLGRSAVGNIIKVIPAVGTVTGGIINAGVAVAITESLGWVTVKMLNDGEDLFDQVMSFKGQFSMLVNAVQKENEKNKNKKSS